MKITIWPAVVLILVTLFMFLFRSSLEVFITRWESFKMGDIEVKVETEQDKKFLENLLVERDAFISNLRLNVDSLVRIIDTLQGENQQLIKKLEDASRTMSQSARQSTRELVESTRESVQSSSNAARTIGEKTDIQYKSIQAITSPDNFKQSLDEVNKGFDLLLAEKYDEALEAFRRADKLYPSVQKGRKTLSVYIEDNIEDLRSTDELTRKRAFAAVLREYVSRMPQETRKKLEQIVLKTP